MESEEMVKLSTFVYNKYFNRYSGLREDLISEGLLGIVRGLPEYKEERGKFGSYICACAKNSMLMFLMRELKYINNISNTEVETFYEILPDERAGSEPQMGAKMQLEKLRGMTKGMKLRKQVLLNEILDCKTPKEIASAYGISKQRVSKVFLELKRKAQQKYKLVDNTMVDKEIWESDKSL